VSALFPSFCRGGVIHRKSVSAHVHSPSPVPLGCFPFVLKAPSLNFRRVDFEGGE